MSVITGRVARYLEENTDTDVIIPARFLKRTSLDGFEEYAFFEKRYSPETVCIPTIEEKDYVFKKKVMNPNCSLNHSSSGGASFLMTWCNFGCGSSREHAVYALKNYQVIIGSSPKGKSAFADIFRDNCRQNLIWTPVISPDDHRALNVLIDSHQATPFYLTLNTEKKQLSWKEKKFTCNFELPEHHFNYILSGEDPFQQALSEITTVIEEVDDWMKTKKNLLGPSPSTKN